MYTFVIASPFPSLPSSTGDLLGPSQSTKLCSVRLPFFFQKKKAMRCSPSKLDEAWRESKRNEKKKKNQRSGWSKRRGQDRSSTNKQAKGNKTTKTGRRRRARRVELTTLSSPAPFPPAPRYLPHHQPPPSSRQQRPEPSSPPRPLRFTLGGGRTWRRGAGGCSGRATTFWQIPL